jgi:hypothetical protein
MKWFEPHSNALTMGQMPEGMGQSLEFGPHPYMQCSCLVFVVHNSIQKKRLDSRCFQIVEIAAGANSSLFEEAVQPIQSNKWKYDVLYWMTNAWFSPSSTLTARKSHSTSAS